jgi:HAE1 family hydrophobic/amphiphilic exporter-1
VVVIFTNYEGAGPEEVEKAVSRTLEGVLGNVSNLEKITSTSSTGSSQIRLDFAYGTDMAEASNEIRDNLEFVKGFLPDEVESPRIFKFNPNLIPIMEIALTGNRTPEELRDIAESLVQPKLEQVEGVSLAAISGGREEAVVIEITQNRLEALGLSLTQLAATLPGQNAQVSGGSIAEGSLNYLIRTVGEFTSIEEIKETVIAYKGAPPNPLNPNSRNFGIKLGEIAEVYRGLKREESRVLINETPGVTLSIQKQSGTNSVATADRVKVRVDQLQGSLPPGIELVITSDTTRFIRNSLDQVWNSAIQGGFFAIFILFLFLRNTKSTLIIGFTIPISFIITLMLMYFFDLTLNIMTLSGLVLGLGMLVDNSIVILENIYHYREKGTKLKPAAILGTQEMVNAIVASTLTTVSVFAPMLIFQRELGVTGSIFGALAFTIVISLVSSLLVAMILVPVLSSTFLPLYTRRQKPLPGFLQKVDNVFESFFKWLESTYKWFLSVILKNWKRQSLLIGLVFVSLVFALYGLTTLPSTLYPAFGDDIVTVRVELPPGSRLEATKEVMSRLELLVREEIQGIENLLVTSGNRSNFGLGALNSNRGSLTITLPPIEERIEDSEEIKRRLRAYFNSFPGATLSFGQNQRGLSGDAIDLVIKSEDLDAARDYATQVQELIKRKMEEMTEPSILEPTVNFTEGAPQSDVRIDRERAYSYGLSIGAIGREIRANVDGVIAGRYREDGQEIDIQLILDPKDRATLNDIGRIPLQTPTGERIYVADINEPGESRGPQSIVREDQARVLHLTAGIRAGLNEEEVINQLEEWIQQEIPQPEGISSVFEGDYLEKQEQARIFALIFLSAVLLVYGIMAAQFESLMNPFIILLTIPMTLIGVFLSYYLSGATLNLMTAVGGVMLVGIVVNNGIVLVDYINLLRKRGQSIVEAALEAGRSRLRPILMTTLTTILGLIPMAFFGGEGNELVQPIAVTVIGGLASGTFLTLFFIPSLYALVNNPLAKLQEKRLRKRKIAEERAFHHMLELREASQEGQKENRDEED